MKASPSDVPRLPLTLFEFAQKFIGLREVPGSKDNPAILAALQLSDDWPQHDEVPWCAGAINALAWMLDLPYSRSLMARSWLKIGFAVDLQDAREGWDVVVLWRGSRSASSGHVGIYAGHDSSHVWMLGGNQDDEFNITKYPRNRVLGVRRLLK